MAAVGEYELAAQSRHVVCQIGDNPIYALERHYQVAIANHVKCRHGDLRALKRRYSKSIGEARLMVGNAIRMICRSPKSRAGCHFAATIGLRSMLEDFAPEIPDWALDQHTLEGRRLKRGLTHFREEGARLIPEPTEPDLYIEEAYRLWQIKAQRK